MTLTNRGARVEQSAAMGFLLIFDRLGAKPLFIDRVINHLVIK